MTSHDTDSDSLLVPSRDITRTNAELSSFGPLQTNFKNEIKIQTFSLKNANCYLYIFISIIYVRALNVSMYLWWVKPQFVID